MNQAHITKIAKELKIQDKQVLATAAFLEEDATIPFIARYRKEATGSLDETAITIIRDRLHQLQELAKLAKEFLPRYAGCLEFVNADMIAGGLSPFAPEKADIRAGRLVLEQIHVLAQTGSNFAFETTLSGKHT